MKKLSFLHAGLFFFLLMFLSCGWMGRLGKVHPVNLRFLDEKILSPELSFRETNVRGLSGIDYNPARNEYYIISDDRSENQPARYYTARITLKGKRIEEFEVLDVDTLRDINGMPFGYKAVDPESIRFDALSGFWAWTSEGERAMTEKRYALTQPGVYLMNKNGIMLDSFRLPDRFRVNAVEKGVRDNGVFEAMSYTPDFRQLWLCMEEPLYDDGRRIDTAYNNSYVRLLGYDRFTKKPVGEYAYQPEKVVWPPDPPDAYRINGISEILFLDSTRFLVMERSFSTGHRSCVVRIFLADLRGATEVSRMESLTVGRIQPVSKQLLLDTRDLDRYTDNLEGMCWGPRLSNGNRSLILISDDNFSRHQQTQLWLLELRE